MSAKKTVVEVHKFGGASLGDGAAFRHAVSIVKGRPGPCVVVVSGAGRGDRCVAGAGDPRGRGRSRRSGRPGDRRRDAARALPRHPDHGRRRQGGGGEGGAAEIDRSFDELGSLLSSLVALKELTPRTRDFVVSRGERLSAQVFAAGLAAAGTPSTYVDATEIVFTDGPFGGASPNLPLTDMAARKKLAPLVAAGKVPVVPGFIGSAKIEDDGDAAVEERAVATLGRGGSDLTATLLGRALSAREVSLWKDVPGLLTADPRVVVRRPRHPAAAPARGGGAGVLRREGAAPARADPGVGAPDSGVRAPVRRPRRRRAPRSRRGARWTSTRSRRCRRPRGQALITVGGNGMLGVPGIAARTFEALHQEGISVSLISQSSSEQSICFSVPEASGKRARARLVAEFRDEIARKEIDGIEVQAGLATVAVVGLGMAGHLGIASRVFSALAEAGINIVAIAQGSSELNISFVVAGKDVAPAQRAVHAAFQLAKIGGGSATRAAHRDVVLLGFGQIGRALARHHDQAQERRHAQAAAGGGDRHQRLRVRARRPDGADGRRAGRGQAVGAQPGRHARGAPRGARRIAVVPGAARAGEPDPGRRDRGRHDAAAARRAGLRHGRRARQQAPAVGARSSRATRCWRAVERGHQRLLTEATVGAGLPIFDTFRKLVESGDRVLKIEGCLSGTLGFVLTEVERGKSFSQALRRAMELGYTEPDPRDDLSGVDVGRKALILGRLLGFSGEPDDVAVESLVPEAMRKLARDAFLAKLPDVDAGVGATRGRREGEGRDAALRGVGRQGPHLGRAADRRTRSARSSGSRGPTTRSRSRPFVTARTRWSSPARAPARRSRRPAC